jgi:teichuronic acid biosynthesis glycosyltransferase TuaH
MEKALIKGHDFIIFGLQPWDISIGSNCKNIAAEISKHNRVLYVNRPLDRISSMKSPKDIPTKNRIESIKKGINVLTKVSNNLWVLNPRVIVESINNLPSGFLYNFMNKRNSKKISKEIFWAISELDFKNVILINDNDFFHGFYLKEFLKPTHFIYYIRDFILSQKYFMKHGKRAEPLMIKQADVVAANSKYLASYAAKYNSSAVDVGQGCDVEDFLNIPSHIPADIRSIPYPIIGYCGSLTSTRLNINLIYFIALHKPEWNIVLVGPEDETFKKSSLHDCKNVFFLGTKQPAELPEYTHTFNVCINPQLLNEMTIGNYPRKVDEYLASGKPVVATKTEAMEMFGDNVYLCETPEMYIEKIELALEEANDETKKEAKREMAKSHTWEASVSKIYKSIQNLQVNYETV